jgi:hypothetical protein
VSDLPTPLTPADCDLRDFPFMPLDVVRLRDSDISALSTGDEFRCAVLLWCACWHQIPAASLPDDDIVLSQLAGFGRVVKEWKKVRNGALRGWIKCDDGRLYHPVVAEKANDAWKGRIKYRDEKEKERVRKAEVRARAKAEDDARRATEDAGRATTKADLSGGQADSVRWTDAECPPENALRGKGKGIGTVDRDSGQGLKTEQNQVKPLVEQTQLDPVSKIFAYWQKTMDSPKSVMDGTRRALIAKALKAYEPAEICKAIRGCSKTPHNMGKNDRGTKFNGLNLILRDAEHIDYFRNLDTTNARPAAETITEMNARIAAEFLGDEQADDNTIEMET